MKKSLIITLLLLFTSCSAISDNLIGSFPQANYFFARFPQNKKAIVIFKFFSEKQISENKLWCRVSSIGAKVSDSKFCINFSSANLNEMMMIEPGTYKMAGYIGEMENGEYFYRINPKKLSNKNKYPIIFEAKEGEITYVGALREDENYIKVHDEIGEIKKYLNVQNQKSLLKIFDNNAQEIDYLIQLYQASPKILVNKLAKIEYGAKSEVLEKVEKYVENVGDKNDLNDLAHLLKIMDAVLKAEKKKSLMEAAKEVR